MSNLKQKQIQLGRTMTEMLGVLAVTGVLSVGGVYGYNAAMERRQTNELLNEATLRATSVSAQMQQELSPTLAEFKPNSGAIEGVSFTLTKPFDFTASPNSDEKQFALLLSGVPKKQCQNIFNSVGSGTAVREIRMRARTPMVNASECTNNATMALVYNADLSSKEYLELMYNSEDCTNAGFYWCEDYGNGEQRCLENAALCCPSGGCGEGQTCRQGQCVECVEQQLDNGQTVCMAEGDTVNCVGGYGTPYCTQCSASQGAVHCSSYSDSDSYSGYDHTPCVCGDNYDCSSHSCMNCPPDQTPICSDYVDWTTHGGGCTCAYTDENTQCNDYSQCMTCAQNETVLCPEDSYGGGACVCVPPDKKGACPYYGDCIICEKGEEATCGESSCICHPNGSDAFCNYSGCVVCAPDEEMVCNSGDDYYKSCVCQKPGETSGCSNIIDDCPGCSDVQASCISCPTGQKPLCIEKSSSLCCDNANLCKCVDENANTMCPDDFGGYYDVNKCVACENGTEAKCEGSECSCLPEGYTFECNGGECITCSPEEGAATCPVSGVCFCLAENETYKCSSTKCIECTAEQGEATCPNTGECVCAPAGSETLCNAVQCISCTEEQGTPICSDAGDCICVPEGADYKCNNSECVVCTESTEIAVCAEVGACTCLPEGSTYDCGESGCITCTEEQGTAKCPASGADCVCVPAGSSYDCSTSGCKTCTPEEGEAQCSKYGDCICVPEGSNYKCSFWKCVSCTEAEGQPFCDRNCTCTQEEICQMGGENINGVCCKSGKAWDGTAYILENTACGCPTPSECQTCEYVNGNAKVSFLPQGTACIQSETEGTCTAYGQCKPSGTSCSSVSGCPSGYFCNYGGTFGNYGQGQTPNICQKPNPQTYTYQGVTYYYNTSTDLKSWCRPADGGTNCTWGYLAYDGARSWCESIGKRLLTTTEYAEVSSVIGPLLPPGSTKAFYWLSNGSAGSWGGDYQQINSGVGRKDGYANCCGVICR